MGEAPPVIVEIRKFISAHTHKTGSPADADKSDFQAFVTSFRLPSQHKSLVHLRALADLERDWWIDATLQVAESGGNLLEIKRMIPMAVSLGADKDHPKLVRSVKILEN